MTACNFTPIKCGPTWTNSNKKRDTNSRDFGMAGSDYTGTKLALNFTLKGLILPNYVINRETVKSVTGSDDLRRKLKGWTTAN